MSVPASSRVALVEEYGGPKKIAVKERPIPAPAAGELLIRVHAAGVNLVDTMFREGYLNTGPLPIVLGSDFAGTVIDPGDTAGYAPGDEVFGYKLLGNGTYADHACVDASLLAPKPPMLSFVQAAALPCAGLIAYDAIINTLALAAGETILIAGASGGVGHLAVQIAKARGAKVIATTSGPNIEFVTALGADAVIDYTTADIPSAVRELAPDGVDAALPTVTAAEASSLKATRDGGRITWINTTDGPTLEREISGHETNGSSGTELLRALSELVQAGSLPTIHIDRTYPLEQTVRAQLDVVTGHVRGKLVIDTTA